MRTIKHTPVERIDYLDKKEFLLNYKLANKPVVIEKLTEDWPARKKWNVDYITEVAGDCVVPLYDSKPSKDNKHQHAPAIEMKLKDYFELLDQGENDLRLFFYNILSGVPELAKDFSYPEIGLHFFKKLPVLFAGGRGAKVPGQCRSGGLPPAGCEDQRQAYRGYCFSHAAQGHDPESGRYTLS